MPPLAPPTAPAAPAAPARTTPDAGPAAGPAASAPAAPAPAGPPAGAARSPTLAYAAVFAGTWLVLSALVSSQVVLSAAAMGMPMHLGTFARARAIEGSALLLYLPTLLALARVAPAERVGLPRHLLVVLGALVPVAALASAWGLEAGRLAFGGRLVIKGSQAARAITEYCAVASAAVVAAGWALHRRLREREAHALQLEARLAEARLQALASQLHPHFLFNTLSAAATLLHRDAAAADAMLTRLADLLRATLRQPTAHEIPLRDELALLERYVDIMRIRYGPRLAVRVEVDPALHHLLVPSFLLQPLVENAIEHGVARRAGPGSVTVRAARDGDRLRLEVADDGPGLAARARDAEEQGIGLPNTRRRLRELYGDAQRLSLAHEAGVGTCATVELPARRAAGRAGGAGGDAAGGPGA